MGSLWKRLECLEESLRRAEGSQPLINPETVAYLDDLAARKRTAEMVEEREEVEEEIRRVLDVYRGEG